MDGAEELSASGAAVAEAEASTSGDSAYEEHARASPRGRRREQAPALHMGRPA